MTLHEDTRWYLEWLVRRLIAEAPRAELFVPDVYRRRGGRIRRGGIARDRPLVAVRHWVIRELRRVRVGGRALSTPEIGELLDVDHSTVVLALRKN